VFELPARLTSAVAILIKFILSLSANLAKSACASSVGPTKQAEIATPTAPALIPTVQLNHTRTLIPLDWPNPQGDVVPSRQAPSLTTWSSPTIRLRCGGFYTAPSFVRNPPYSFLFLPRCSFHFSFFSRPILRKPRPSFITTSSTSSKLSASFRFFAYRYLHLHHRPPISIGNLYLSSLAFRAAE